MLKRSKEAAAVSRVLFWLLPLLACLLAADLIRWNGTLRKPLQPILPALEELKVPPGPIPPLPLPDGIFARAAAAPERSLSTATPVAVDEVEWKLKGVLGGAAPRAFLEGSQNQQGVWVSPGDRIGPYTVKEVRDRSVLLEKEGGAYEIRM